MHAKVTIGDILIYLQYLKVVYFYFYLLWTAAVAQAV
jgi:hypothetical protein